MNKYFIEYDNGCKTKRDAIARGLYNIWTPERIERAFNFGKGTLRDFYRYKSDNSPRYCKIVEITADEALLLNF